MSEELTSEALPVPGYAGHADAPSRRLSDQQVRAWVGEALSDLQTRVPVDRYRDRFEALLMRCEFADQHVIKAIEDQRFAEPDLVALVKRCDRTLADGAARARAAGPDDLAGLIETLEHAFDERNASIGDRLKR